MSVLGATHPRPILAGPSVPGALLAGPYIVRIVPFAHLYRHDFEIEALNAQALEQNVFFRPTVLAALAEQGGFSGMLRLVMVHGPDGVLRAMAPLVTLPTIAGGFLRPGRVLCSPMYPDATPLIDAGAPDAAHGLVAGLMQAGGALISAIDLDGPVAGVLEKAAKRKGLKALSFGAHERPFSSSGGPKPTRKERWRLKVSRKLLTRKYGRLRYFETMAGPELEAALAESGPPVTGGGMEDGLMALVLRGQEDAPVIKHHALRAGGTVLARAITMNAGTMARLEVLAIRPGAQKYLAGLVLADMAQRKAAKSGGRWVLACDLPGSDAAKKHFWPQKRRIGQLVVAAPLRAEAERAIGRLKLAR